MGLGSSNLEKQKLVDEKYMAYKQLGFGDLMMQQLSELLIQQFIHLQLSAIPLQSLRNRWSDRFAQDTGLLVMMQTQHLGFCCYWCISYHNNNTSGSDLSGGHQLLLELSLQLIVDVNG